LYEAILARETNHSIKILRTDNGGESMSGEFLQYLAKEGIKHETSTPYTPQQNGVAEREKRTVMESARSLLHARNVPLHLWAEAVACAVYCLNRALSTVNTDVTPFEGCYKRKPTVSHLRIFGSQAYVHIPDVLRTKLDPKSELCVFVGYSETQKAYRF
jgi:transposase InsO family protein